MPTSILKVFIFVAALFSAVAHGQDLVREIETAPEPTISITNMAGRVSVIADNKSNAKAQIKLTARSAKAVNDSDLKIVSGKASVTIDVTTTKGKRVDLELIVPVRSRLKIVSDEGQVEVGGDLAEISVSTDTGTTVIDVPTTLIEYKMSWTESRPRFVSDFDLGKVSERSGGRFEIKGRYSDGATRSIADPSEPSVEISAEKEKKKKRNDGGGVRLDLTTARGVVLINVPPNEVGSDLRERPLTDAAKAIVRSGDSLLMDAIRRAAPKYYGDYLRSLPPLIKEPRLSSKPTEIDEPNAAVKTATVRVTDEKNRAIAGLLAKDFEVFENGKPREIISVNNSNAPFNLVLLLDVSGSVDNYVNFIRKAARSFVQTVRKDDRVAIVIFNDDVKMLSGFTTDKGLLLESLDTFDAGGGTAFYDALAYTVSDTLRPLKGDRTAIVILTDGDDNRSFLGFDSLIGSIQESGALIYPLYVPSALIANAEDGHNIDPMRQKYMSLTAKSQGEGEKLAKISGGVYYPISQIGQIQKAYEDIVVQLRSAYDVAYRSTLNIEGRGTSPRLRIHADRPGTFTTVTNVRSNDK